MGNRFDGTRLGVLMEHDEIAQSGFVLGTEVLPQAVLTGTPGDDTLIGGRGKDTLDGGLGADKMKGRGGNDTYVVDNTGDRVIEGRHKGIDTVLSSVDFTLGENVEHLTFTGSSSLTGIGNALGNVMVGNTNHNFIYGLEGNDQITGGSAGDRLEGGLGDDVLAGVGGYDTLVGGDGNDRLTAQTGDFTGGAGDDLLVSRGGGGMMWADEGNDTVVGGLGADRVMMGGEGDDFMDGGGGEDQIRGDGGNDILLGGSGPDYLRGGAGNDTVVGGNAGGLDTSTADQLFGDDGDDLLSGRGGEDVFTGGAGADIFNFDAFGGTVQDFQSGIDKINISQLTLPVGDGDAVVEGAMVLNGPGGFAPASELVIISRTLPGNVGTAEAAVAIGSASSAYSQGQTAVFVVHNDLENKLFYFQSLDANAVVSANELSWITTLVLPHASGTLVSDYLFDSPVLPQPFSSEAAAHTLSGIEPLMGLIGHPTPVGGDDLSGF